MSQTGKNACHLCGGDGKVTVNVTCTACHGTGSVNDSICSPCWGTGKVSEVRTCPYCLGTGKE